MKQLYCIGGGELKDRTTLKLDEILASKAKIHAKDKRAYALFIPTASHDFMPYYNTFHKVYTGLFDIKTDVALTVFHEFDIEKIKAKFLKADLIYIGGGDTVFMIDSFKKTGLLDLIKDAYERGVIIAGLSAGAICYFKNIYTDSLKEDNDTKYGMYEGLGWFNETITPHYNKRKEDFDKIVLQNYQEAYGIEDNAMLYIEDDAIKGSYSSNEGHVYKITKCDDKIVTFIVENEVIL